jgi:hypothetical protein
MSSLCASKKLRRHACPLQRKEAQIPRPRFPGDFFGISLHFHLASQIEKIEKFAFDFGFSFACTPMIFAANAASAFPNSEFAPSRFPSA